MTIKCTSCKKVVISENDFSKFNCPACEKQEIIRCKNCRRQVIPYKCECGFEGP